LPRLIQNSYWKKSVIILVNNLCARQIQAFAASGIGLMARNNVHKGKGSNLRFRPLVHYHNRLQPNGTCKKVLKHFFLKIAFISKVSLHCTLPYGRIKQNKHGGINIYCSTYLAH